MNIVLPLKDLLGLACLVFIVVALTILKIANWLDTHWPIKTRNKEDKS